MSVPEPKPTRKPKVEIRVGSVFFRGQLIKKDGVTLPGYEEAGRAMTAALLRPLLSVPNREGEHAAD